MKRMSFDALMRTFVLFGCTLCTPFNCIERLLTIKTVTPCPTVSNHHWSLILLCLLTVDGQSAQTHVSSDCWILNCTFCSSAFSTASRVGSNYVSLFFSIIGWMFFFLFLFFHLIKKQLLYFCVRWFSFQCCDKRLLISAKCFFLSRFRWTWQKHLI